MCIKASLSIPSWHALYFYSTWSIINCYNINCFNSTVPNSWFHFWSLTLLQWIQLHDQYRIEWLKFQWLNCDNPFLLTFLANPCSWRICSAQMRYLFSKHLPSVQSLPCRFLWPKAIYYMFAAVRSTHFSTCHKGVQPFAEHFSFVK